jgi:alkylated DNA repair protein alkB family protein 4
MVSDPGRGLRERAKSCRCTGVRWCAACVDPRVREAHGMDDPLVLPDFLASAPAPGTHPGDPPARVAEFDVESQSAPGCPGFAGVVLVPELVSEPEAAALLARIEERPFVAAQSGKWKQHYGARVNFRRRKANAERFEGLPGYAGWLESRLRERLAARTGPSLGRVGPPGLAEALDAFRTRDVFVLRYRAAQQSNLDLHVDDTWAYGEAILDLSLESDAAMTFLRGPVVSSDGPLWECVRVAIPARSMLVLFGPARFEWQHAILAYDVEGRRTSVTLRTLGPELARSETGRCIAQRARAVIDRGWCAEAPGTSGAGAGGLGASA